MHRRKQSRSATPRLTCAPTATRTRDLLLRRQSRNVARAPFTDRLRLAAAACLARFKGSSRRCTESDLRCYLAWGAGHGLNPLAAQRPHLELYIGSMHEIRRLKPSTVSRPFSVAAGSTGPASSTASWSTRPPSTCAARRYPPNRPRPGSPTCSSRPCSPPPASQRTRATSRWWPCPACRARGSSKPPAPTSPTPAKNTATGCCGRAARAPRSSWSRCRQRPAGPSTGRPALPGPRADPAKHPQRPDGPARGHPPLRHLAETAGIQTARAHPHMLRHTYLTTMLGRWRRLARRARGRLARRPQNDDAV